MGSHKTKRCLHEKESVDQMKKQSIECKKYLPTIPLIEFLSNKKILNS